jgi:hypothetical protein
MIHVNVIENHLDRLSGEAVKLAVHLCCIGGELIRADKAWQKKVAKKLGLTPVAVGKALRELAKERLVKLANRVELTSSMSYPPASLARRIPVGLDDGVLDGTTSKGSESETEPPWLRRSVERSETEGSGGAERANGIPCLEASGNPTTSPHRLVVEAIDKMYFDVYGAKATWGGRAGSTVKSLLKLHPAEEIIRRAKIMFYESRRWPPPPYDVGTLSLHFDKFAVERTIGGMVGDAKKTGATYYGEVDDV